MVSTPVEPSSLSALFIEGSLTLVGVALAIGWPRMGNSFFLCIERTFGRLARRQGLAVLVVGLSALLLRLALLPFFPIPIPFAPDDFSMLLAADTFLHGRLANPTPSMWVHFETVHETMRPTYASMYFPGVGLVLAGGKLLFGHPWFGILIATALMCAALCWMLQAWLPPGWALLGGLLAVVRLGIFSYWVNSYTGGASIAVLGGALILGALPRFLRSARAGYAVLIAIGIVLVAYTRPYEGVLLCLPVAAALGDWLLKGKTRPAIPVLLRRTAGAMAILVMAGAWLGYYDYRAFGSPTTLPYTVDRATYAMAPYYVWQKPRPEPQYRHVELRRFYEQELVYRMAIQPLKASLLSRLICTVSEIRFLCGIALLPPLLMLPLLFRDRRIRFMLYCLLVLLAGASIESYFLPHYAAPFMGVIYLLGIQMMRHLRQLRDRGRRVGVAMVRMVVVVCVTMLILRPFDRVLHFPVHEWPPAEWLWEPYGPDHFGVSRAAVEDRLEHASEKELAIVRYSAEHYPLDEWVYNGADIDGQKVIWARDMDAASNQELFRYYKDRTVWLVQPDTDPVSVTPYPTEEAVAASAAPANPRP